MRRRFKNHNINQLGYTDNTNTMYNNFNTIPGNNITMQNTSFPVVGQGLDQYGNPITQPVTMQPGQDYQFGNASFVQETPQLQGGGTYDVPTYYPPAPSVANNFNQPYGINDWNRAYLTGQGQPLQQEPTVVQQGMIDANYPEVVTPQEDVENNNQGTFQFYNPYGGYSVENASFQLGQGIQEGNTLQTVGAGLKMLTGLGRNVMSGMGYQNRNNQIMEEYRRQQRNAMTQQNRPQIMQEGGEVQMSQEEQLIQGVVQALQEGISPEEVLQALVQQGLDEATATELIQGIMQQMQAPQQQQQEVMKRGGEYLSKMKGKKIKNYTYNSKTGNYDVEFE